MRNLFAMLGLSLVLVLSGCSSEPSAPPPPPTVYTVTQYLEDGTTLQEWKTEYVYTSDGNVTFRPSDGPSDARLHIATGAVVVRPTNNIDFGSNEEAKFLITLYKGDGSVMHYWRAVSFYSSDGAIVFRVPGAKNNHYVTGVLVVRPLTPADR